MPNLKQRFNRNLPVVLDLETGGVNPTTDALLEVAIVLLDFDGESLVPTETHAVHIEPAKGLRLDPKALEITGIIPDHPFRFAKPESDALKMLFEPINQAVKAAACQRAMLIGHNAHFDLSFINAACTRQELTSPFHRFSVLDTATLSMLAYHNSILASAVRRAGIDFNEKEAHSARYDAEKTADLFCKIFNRWGHEPVKA